MDYYQDFHDSFSICACSGEARSVKCVFTFLSLLDSLQSRFVQLVPRHLASWLGRRAPPKTDRMQALSCDPEFKMEVLLTDLHTYL